MKQSQSCGGRFSTAARRSVGGAIERLGLQFLESLPVGPQQPNVILSPVSLAFALAQLTLGQSELSLAYCWLVCCGGGQFQTSPPGPLLSHTVQVLLDLLVFPSQQRYINPLSSGLLQSYLPLVAPGRPEFLLWVENRFALFGPFNVSGHSLKLRIQIVFLSGARNETEKLLLKSLHAHSVACYHHILGGLLPHFRNTSLDIATRMYLRPGVCRYAF